MSLCDLVKNTFVFFLWMMDMKRVTKRDKIWGHLECNSVVYLLLSPSRQSITLAAKNNSVINSHSNQLRCLRATKQTTGLEGILARKPLKMMNSLFSCQKEIWRDTVYCDYPTFTNNYYSVSSGWKITQRTWPKVEKKKKRRKACVSVLSQTFGEL